MRNCSWRTAAPFSCWQKQSTPGRPSLMASLGQGSVWIVNTHKHTHIHRETTETTLNQFNPIQCAQAPPKVNRLFYHGVVLLACTCTKCGWSSTNKCLLPLTWFKQAGGAMSNPVIKDGWVWKKKKKKVYCEAWWLLTHPPGARLLPPRRRQRRAGEERSVRAALTTASSLCHVARK